MLHVKCVEVNLIPSSTSLCTPVWPRGGFMDMASSWAADHRYMNDDSPHLLVQSIQQHLLMLEHIHSGIYRQSNETIIGIATEWFKQSNRYYVCEEKTIKSRPNLWSFSLLVCGVIYDRNCCFVLVLMLLSMGDNKLCSRNIGEWLKYKNRKNIILLLFAVAFESLFKRKNFIGSSN